MASPTVEQVEKVLKLCEGGVVGELGVPARHGWGAARWLVPTSLITGAGVVVLAAPQHFQLHPQQNKYNRVLVAAFKNGFCTRPRVHVYATLQQVAMLPA